MTGKKGVLGLACVMGICLVWSAGCRGRSYEGPLRAAVAGMVTLDGVPVERGIINLLPVAGDLRKASAPIEHGRYDIPEEKGPNLGKYYVEIHWPKPTGRRSHQKVDILDGPAEETAEAIPAKYNTQTTLQVELTPGRNQHDFALTGQ